MEDYKMGQKSKKEYLISIYRRYHQADKKGKAAMLNEFCNICSYNRKYAIWKLNQPLPENPKERGPKRRCFTYSQKAILILEGIWKAAEYPWSVRLKALLPIWLPWAKKHYEIDIKTEKELLSISPRQIDRRLRLKKLNIKKRIYGTTKPGSLLKHQIPIRTSNWDITKAGYLEIDTVAHCGNSLGGDFIYTLNATDIKTTWVERVAVMGKGQAGIFKGILEIRDSLPFRLRGIDSDNGSEFINDHLYRFCINSKPKIEFTRSRAYEKEDNGTIEQKNWTHVRKIFGWDRYDTKEVQIAMNDLYQNELRWRDNFFMPSVKLIKKIRIGSRVKRVYDKAKTPFQRVLECKEADSKKVEELEKIFNALDPFELSKVLDQKLERIYKMASQRIRNQKDLEYLKKQTLKSFITQENTLSHIPTPPKIKTPWRGWTFGKAKRIKTLMRKKIREYELSLR